jgi:secreted PhoX family phosphatase
VVNHEYIEPRYLHASWKGKHLGRNEVVLHKSTRDKETVLKEMHAHGVSIFRIKRNPGGEWQIVPDAKNRRITARTPMLISGPAKGHPKMKTKYAPKGDRTRGTLNNCSHGVTPWNTYLVAEENWASYFLNTSKDYPREQKRYGIRQEATRYHWEKVAPKEDEFERFDCRPIADNPTDDYRHEPNHFGWIVEVDPFNPNSTPVKRTALGRFAHEGVVFQPPIPGQPLVCYSGDDTVFEYIYKFVSRDVYDPNSAGGHLLDHGTLFVAKFNEDFTGEWIPLVFGERGLTPENGFADQGDILINTRTAADFVGATKMDRPEWGAVDPKTRAVYFSLSNNEKRSASEKNGPNPREKNFWGQIIKWHEAGNNPASNTFSWSLFALGGPKGENRDPKGGHLTEDNLFCCPDGLWFDPQRRLWIQTDIAETHADSKEFSPFGNNQMLVANPDTGEIKRFLIGPVGQEITGVVMTPDQTSMFVNVQHPGSTTSAADFARGQFSSNWPDGGKSIPRSATLVITRKDGGKI